VEAPPTLLADADEGDRVSHCNPCTSFLQCMSPFLARKSLPAALNNAGSVGQSGNQLPNRRDIAGATILAGVYSKMISSPLRMPLTWFAVDNG